MVSEPFIFINQHIDFFWALDTMKVTFSVTFSDKDFIFFISTKTFAHTVDKQEANDRNSFWRQINYILG